VITDEDLAVVLDAGARAPSFFNMQPWRVVIDRDHFTVLIDRARATALIDRQARVSAFAVGAFVENCVLAARALGRVLTTTVEPGATPFDIQVHLAATAECVGDRRLLDEVLERETNRSVYSRALLTDVELAPFRVEGPSPFSFQLLTDDRRDALAEILGLSAAVVNFQARLWEEQRRFLRLTPEEARETADGIDLETLPIDEAGRRFMRALDRFEKVEELMDAETVATQAAMTIKNASHVVVLTTNGECTPAHMIDAGRIFERAWIESGARGVAMHPTGVLGLFSVLDDAERSHILDADGADDIRQLTAAAHDLLGLDASERMVFAARLSRGTRSPIRSIRRPWQSFTTFIRR